MVSLALNVIVKDEYDEVVRIITDYKKCFSELCFAVDDLETFNKLSEKYKETPHIRFFKYDWCDDFAHKRNFLAEETESAYYFRMDCDDEIEHPEKIWDIFEKMVGRFDIVFVPYIYSRDQDGNCIAEHWRETIIKKRPEVKWNKPVHENLHYESNIEILSMKTDYFQIIHRLTDEHSARSSERNLRILLKEFQRDKQETDPRTISYIGRIYMELGYCQEAIPFLELLIEKSGWNDDKYFAWIHLAECHRALGNIELSLAACNEALEINTSFPDAYISKGVIYLWKQDYVKALDWLMYGVVRPKPDTMFVINPSIYGWRVRLYIATAYLGKGMYEEALKWFLDSKKLSPTNPDVVDKEKVFLNSFESNEFLKHLMWLLEKTKDPDIKEKLLEAIPKSYLLDERFWAVKNAHGKPKTWADKSIVIYCGSSWEEWTPPNVISGIGGSEEAVIYLSRELVKLGWEVTVFNRCGENKGIYDGVEYRNFYEFNLLDNYNNLISWRNDIFRRKKIKARNRIVWLHDVINKTDYSTGEDYLEKVMVLSKFQKSMLSKELPESRIYISSNGINVEDFKPSLLPRNPHRMIYTSSYDRGIEHLLMMWKDIRKEVPDAELHLFYGWKTYVEMEKAGLRPVKFRQLLLPLMEQDGIFEHGRIGHRELIKEFYKSGVWVYPCHFEEISCISAMKAQACGCVPVTTDYAALDETVKGGVKVPGQTGEGDTNERYKEALIKVLKDTDYQEELRKMLPDKDVFSWARVAKEWEKDLLNV